MSDPRPEKPDEEKESGRVQTGVLKALRGSGRFTPQEQEDIASTIESEVARLLPELPEGITEIAFKAIGLSLDAADKLAERQERPPADEQPDS